MGYSGGGQVENDWIFQNESGKTLKFRTPDLSPWQSWPISIKKDKNSTTIQRLT
jgi:hypothetical protein